MRKIAPLAVAMAALLHASDADANGAVLRADVAEKFRPYASLKPDARWNGCWLYSVGVPHEQIVLSFRCSEAASLKVTLSRARSGSAGDGVPCLNGASVHPFLDCRATGDMEPEAQDKLLTALSQRLPAILPGNPYWEPEDDRPARLSFFARSLATLKAAVHYIGKFLPDLTTAGSELIVIFLALSLAGFFGRINPDRRDWIVAVPFLIALTLRQCFTLHTIEQINLQFATEAQGRHSVTWPLVQLFFKPFARDFQSFVMNLNGVIGSLATVPLFAFVRQRTGSRKAGLLAALFLALDPLVTRFSPTDGPYSLILLAWFWGLALLSGTDLTARRLFGGIVLIGIAGTCRLEGALYVAVCVLLLDLRPTFAALWRYRWISAIAIGISAVLLAVQMRTVSLLGTHIMPDTEAEWFGGWMRDSLTHPFLGGRILPALFLMGALAGLLRRDSRIGFFAMVGALVLVMPVAKSGMWFLAHRLVPARALQDVAAAIGAWASGRVLVFAWSLLAPPGWTLSGALNLSPRTAWLRALVILIPGVAAAVSIAADNAEYLTHSWFWDDEYRMVRSRLAPAGTPQTPCTLVIGPGGIGVGDVDIIDYRMVVPEATVLSCDGNECADQLVDTKCAYYIRSTRCYTPIFKRYAPQCEFAMDMAAAPECNICLPLERSLRLEPLESLELSRPNPAPEWDDTPMVIEMFKILPPNPPN